MTELPFRDQQTVPLIQTSLRPPVIAPAPPETVVPVAVVRLVGSRAYCRSSCWVSWPWPFDLQNRTLPDIYLFYGLST